MRTRSDVRPARLACARFARVASLIVVLGGALPASAQQRPLVTEDPETIGAGRVLVEGGAGVGVGLEIPVYGLEGDLYHLPALGVSAGISSIAEIQVDGGFNVLRITARRDAPLASILAIDGGSTSSIDDIVIATKVRIAGERGRRPAIGIRVATKLPNARNQSGLGTDLTDFSLSLLLGKTFGPFRLAGNAGLALVGDPTQKAVQSDPFVYGVSIARTVADRVAIVGEVAGRFLAYQETPPAAAENHARILGGVRYGRGRMRVDGAVAAGLTRIDAGLAITGGVTWVFEAFQVP